MNKNYVPLYRKYRPQTIEQIVGQSHIKKALANAIEMNRISHAYLFTGPRGTGKTSTARIFAKSLNCSSGPTINPCNECENCKNITNSIPIDVIEIDAASNRSVSDAEEIIQNVAMAPVHSRYKIYIIDEVHMLSTTAFNALLKTLEEPPENVIFILATTEVHKVLDTIKSRCQRFDFKRITTEDITNHLKYISEQEKINITDEALNFIAQTSAGGMRDSIALLDQLSVLNSSDAITIDSINSLLGRLSFDSLVDLFTKVVKAEQEVALEILNNIYNQGNEPSQILTNFLEFLRNSLIIKSVGIKNSQNLVQLNSEQMSVISKNVEDIETHQLASLINKCSYYIKELKLSTNPKLWLDVSILDMANIVENTKLDDLQKRVQLLESGVALKNPNTAYTTSPSPVYKAESPKKNVDKPVEKAPVANPKNEQAQKQAVSSEQPKQANDLWGKFLEHVSSLPSRMILKQQAVPIVLTETEVILAIKNPTWLKNFGPEGERHKFLLDATKGLFGDNTKLIVRAPMAGDDKLRKDGSSVDASLQKEIPNQAPPKQALIQPVNQEETDFDNEVQESNADTSEPDNQESVQKSKSGEELYHSDEVNMVVELFDGKLIE